jgi:hypothetical protein
MKQLLLLSTGAGYADAGNGVLIQQKLAEVRNKKLCMNAADN